MNKKISLSMAAAVLVGSLFTGCTSSTNDDPTDAPVSSVSGTAVDGYIRNGFVCVDMNNDSECNDDEPYTKTNDLGEYTLDVSDVTEQIRETAKLMLVGGIDSASGKAFQGMMKSPMIPGEDSIHINPVSTIVAAKALRNADAVQAMEEVATTLGIDVSDINADPLKVANKLVYEKNLQIQKSLDVLNAALPEDSINTSTKNMAKIAEKLAEEFKGDVEKDLETIIQNTNFAADAELAEIDGLKLQVQNLVGQIQVIDGSELSDLIELNAKIDEKRDEYIKEINRIEGDYTLSFDDFADLNDKLLAIDTAYDNGEGPLERLMDIMDLEDILEEVDYASVKTTLLNADLTYDLTPEQIKLKIEQLDIPAPIKLKMMKKIKYINMNKELLEGLEELQLSHLLDDATVMAELEQLYIPEYADFDEVMLIIESADFLSTTTKTTILTAMKTLKADELREAFTEGLTNLGLTHILDDVVIMEQLLELNMPYEATMKQVISVIENAVDLDANAQLEIVTALKAEYEKMKAAKLTLIEGIIRKGATMSNIDATTVLAELNAFTDLDFELTEDMDYTSIVGNVYGAVKRSGLTSKVEMMQILMYILQNPMPEVDGVEGVVTDGTVTVDGPETIVDDGAGVVVDGAEGVVTDGTVVIDDTIGDIFK